MDREQFQIWAELHHPSRVDPDPRPHRAPEGNSISRTDALALQQSIVEADRQIGAALRDVAVPPELKQRVLSRLEGARRTSRRTWLSRVAAAAAVAAIPALYLLRPRQAAVTIDDLASQSIDLFVSLPDFGEALAPRNDGPTHSHWPASFDVRTLRGRRTVPFLGQQVEALQFYRHQRWALVLLIPYESFPVETEFPTRYLDSESGLAVHCYLKDDLVNVVVVQGHRDEDLDFFRSVQATA